MLPPVNESKYPRKIILRAPCGVFVELPELRVTKRLLWRIQLDIHSCVSLLSDATDGSLREGRVCGDPIIHSVASMNHGLIPDKSRAFDLMKEAVTAWTLRRLEARLSAGVGI